MLCNNKLWNVLLLEIQWIIWLILVVQQPMEVAEGVVGVHHCARHVPGIFLDLHTQPTLSQAPSKSYLLLGPCYSSPPLLWQTPIIRHTLCSHFHVVTYR